MSEEKKGINSVTGLDDIVSFYDIAPKILDYAHDMQLEFACLYINISRLKSYDQKYGSESGDIFLNFFARLLKKAFKDELVGYFLDGHFVVMPERKGIERKITKIREAVLKARMQSSIDIKVGIYMLSKDDSDIKVIVERAKSAAMTIKNDKEKFYAYFDENITKKSQLRKYIVRNIENAVENGWIKVYYQPVIRVSSGRLCGYEALARWIDPEYGFLSPADFISTLEDFKLIHKLDSFMIEQICRDFRMQLDRGITAVPVSFNISRLDLELCDMFQVLDDAVQQNQVPKDLIHVEITESQLNEDQKLLGEAINVFHESGYEVWMDDFGAGYSSLNVLKDYKFDTLKIDMAFLRSFDTNPNTKIIVSAIVDMAKKLNIRTLAEGVETEEHVKFLRSIGCEKVQGYFYSKPLPLEEVLAKGFIPEDRHDRRYSDEIGKINLTGHSDDPKSVPSAISASVLDIVGLALAVIERRDGKFFYLNANYAYRRLVQHLGASVFSSEDWCIGDENEPHNSKLLDLIERAEMSGVTESVDFVENGDYCTMTMQCIARNIEARTSAYLATLVDLSISGDFNRKKLREQAIHHIFEIYHRVNLIDLETGEIMTVFSNDTVSFNPLEQVDKDVLDKFSIEYIHPDDRKRYLEFYRTDNIDERLKNSEKNFISDLFRVKKTDGAYMWQVGILLPFIMSGKKFLISCVRDVVKERGEALRNMVESGQAKP